MSANATLRLTSLTSPAELESMRSEWDAFVHSSESDIYFTTDWLLAWWEFYGAGRSMRCFLLYEDDRLVAVLPFFTRILWCGPVRIRHAGLIGADSTISVFDPPVAQGFEVAVLAMVLDNLLDTAKCDAVSLSPLSGCSELPATLATHGKIAQQYHIKEAGRPTPHSIFDLSQDFETYLASLGKRTRANFRRELRGLEREYGIVETELSGVEASARFDAFVEMHNTQWQARGGLGHFGDWPDSTAFNFRLMEQMSDDARARLYILSDQNDRALAMEYYFVFGKQAFWRLGARVIDEDIARLGIGRVVLLKLLEKLITEGVKSLEGGPGHYPYKINLGGKEMLLRRLVICQPTAMARIKLALLTDWADLLNLIYYRIWFLRLASKLGVPKKPLWKAWIKTRL